MTIIENALKTSCFVLDEHGEVVYRGSRKNCEAYIIFVQKQLEFDFN